MRSIRFSLQASCAGLAACLTTVKHRVASPDRAYYWSSANGNVGSYSHSEFQGPEQLSSPTWTWNDPRGRWSTIPLGVSIDDEQSLYLTVSHGIRKLSSDGKLLWSYEAGKEIGETINNAASLWDGQIFGITCKGRTFAVDMNTGNEVWSTKIATNTDGNDGQVAAHDGVMIVATDASEEIKGRAKTCCGPANHKLQGLNTTNGQLVWTYTPEVAVWNFAARFAGDGTFIFQDLEGRVHRNKVSDGSLIWKSGGIPGSWTDGAAQLGSNNVVYAPANFKNGGFTKGMLAAYRLSDGAQLWNVTTPRPPNNMPAVGRLIGHTELSVVQPMGQQCEQGQQLDVRVYDAETGKLQWTYEGDVLQTKMVAGDREGIPFRLATGIRPITMPNPFSMPVVDGKGTVYIGAETGAFYSLQDLNGDGRVQGPGEVNKLENGGAFVGASSPAVAPGLFAVADIGRLFVWKTSQ